MKKVQELNSNVKFFTPPQSPVSAAERESKFHSQFSIDIRQKDKVRTSCIFLIELLNFSEEKLLSAGLELSMRYNLENKDFRKTSLEGNPYFFESLISLFIN
jgi:hypothetical protein